jgi:hypothetical protein
MCFCVQVKGGGHILCWVHYDRYNAQYYCSGKTFRNARRVLHCRTDINGLDSTGSGKVTMWELSEHEYDI